MNMNEFKNKVSTLEHIVNETQKSFDELQKLKNAGKKDEIDYDYEIARDRKAAIILKGVLTEVHIENMYSNRLQITQGKKVKIIHQSKND